MEVLTTLDKIVVNSEIWSSFLVLWHTHGMMLEKKEVDLIADLLSKPKHTSRIFLINLCATCQNSYNDVSICLNLFDIASGLLVAAQGIFM